MGCCRAEVFARAKPIYATFSKDILLLGDIGAGQFGKAINNFLLWVNGVALIESGRLSEAYGMDLVKLREALLMSSGGSDASRTGRTSPFSGRSRTCRL
jgi:3-hydroxyisobutyrate dehydrogenase-like beta-hydroxyacid dehydrogenase